MKKLLIVPLLLGLSACSLFPQTPAGRPNISIVEDQAKTSEDETVEILNPNETSAPELNPSRSLNLSRQGLEKMPESVLKRTDLENLDLSSNALSGALPAEIRHLNQLRVLDLHANRMTGIPAEIGQLSRLEILNLADNQLTGLPYELGNLKNLKILDLSGNNYSVQDLEKILETLPADTKIIR